MILLRYAFTLALLSSFLPSSLTIAAPHRTVQRRADSTGSSQSQPTVGLRLANGSVIYNWGSDQNFGCTNMKQNLSISCWDELDVSGYLEKWWANNSQVCQAMQVDFASCYQQHLGLEQQACSTIGPDHCDYPVNFFKGNYTPQESYALYAIFAIWQWFNSIYTAVGNADVTVSYRNHPKPSKSATH